MADIHLKRMREYSEDHCWQYDIRLNNLEQDIEESGLTEEEVNNLSVNDFIFVEVTDKEEQKKMAEFIKRHEWLGNLTQYTTHWFGAYYKGILAGVILMSLPNAFSKLLGENTRDMERLISRGACISWSPKNLASSLLMWSIRHMVKTTPFRLFTAYSDPSANELGTIYQACSFYYLGQKSGTVKRYINPYTGKVVSDRFFRQRSAYRRYAKELGIEWQKDWTSSTRMLWDNIPDDIEEQLREMSREKQRTSRSIEYKPKHKYAFVLGENKKETKMLRNVFLERNKVFPYPKQRGE